MNFLPNNLTNFPTNGIQKRAPAKIKPLKIPTQISPSPGPNKYQNQ